MTKYREILRLRSLGLSQNDIAASCQVSKKTVNKVLKLSNEYNLRWPLEERLTDREIDKIIHPNGNETRKITDRAVSCIPVWRFPPFRNAGLFLQEYSKNLAYAIPGSICRSDNPANCEKYGRLYSWAQAIGKTDAEVTYIFFRKFR